MRRVQEEATQQMRFMRVIVMYEDREGYEMLKWVYHTPNGEHRHPAVAQKLLTMGVRAGVLDIHCPFRGANGEPGLWMDFKKKKGGRKGKKQEEFAAFVQSQGCRVEWPTSARQALDYLTDYMGWHDRPAWVFSVECIQED